MGRTFMPYGQVMEPERERWKPFRRALSKEDQEAFDHPFDRAKLPTGPSSPNSLHGLVVTALSGLD